MNKRLLFVSAPLVLGLMSCTANLPRREPGFTRYPPSTVEPSNDAGAVKDLTNPRPPSRRYVEQSRVVTSTPVTLALLQDARAQSRKGHLDGAVTTVERALIIQPRNAELWYELALLRLKQEESILAESFAKKSNTLAGSNTALRHKNWILISSARRKSGDFEGSLEADRKAKQYDRH